MRNASSENVQRGAANDLLAHLSKYESIQHMHEKIDEIELKIARQKKSVKFFEIIQKELKSCQAVLKHGDYH